MGALCVMIPLNTWLIFFHVQVHPQSSQRGKIFHPERKKRKIEKRKRKGTPFSFNQELCVTAWLLFFCFLVHKKENRKNQQKSKRKSPKKVKDIFKKAWFYGKYLVFRTFLICFSAPCSGPRYRCGADTFLTTCRWSYRRRAGDGIHLSALEPTGKRREKREKGRMKKFAYWGWFYLQLDRWLFRCNPNYPEKAQKIILNHRAEK